MKELKALLKVKSIISLISIGVFAYLSVIGRIEPKDFMMILGMIITFYFSKKEDNQDINQ